MDKAWLTSQLAAGRSIGEIAEEVDRDHSTVSYWVRKHGLRSQHAERHSPRGGLDQAVLQEHVEAGRSTREIAEALDRSQSSVRHWLKRYGLETKQASRRAPEDGNRTGRCPKHGPAIFVRRADGQWRCLQCRSQHVSDRRRRVKAILIAEAGGACVLCGYDRFAGALQFHHRDPGKKAFGIALHGAARSLARAREEAAKCVLLCGNCHAEVEWGDATLPPRSVERRSDGE